MCAQYKCSPGWEAVTSTYTREQFLSPPFFKHNYLPPFSKNSPLLQFHHFRSTIQPSPITQHHASTYNIAYCVLHKYTNTPDKYQYPVKVISESPTREYWNVLKYNWHRYMCPCWCLEDILAFTFDHNHTYRVASNTLYVCLCWRKQHEDPFVLWSMLWELSLQRKVLFCCFIFGSWTMWGRKCHFCSASTICHHREIFLLCMLSKTFTVGYQLCSLNSGIKEKRDIWIYELLQPCTALHG